MTVKIQCTGCISGTLYFLSLLLCLSFALPSEASEQQIKNAVSRFFHCINHRKYQEAYASFSDAIKEEVSFTKFMYRAQDIKNCRIVQLTIYDHDKYLAKLKIKARLYLLYHGHYFIALYGGTCDLQYVGDQWKLITVELKALEQKEILKKPIHFGK